MSKRTRNYLRTAHEIKDDTRKSYASLIKYPSKINPVFLQKPYSACEKKDKKKKEQGGV